MGRYVTPKLSTIRQDTEKIGETAAKLLLDMLADKEVEHKITRIPVSLIIRES